MPVAVLVLLPDNVLAVGHSSTLKLLAAKAKKGTMLDIFPLLKEGLLVLFLQGQTCFLLFFFF